MLQIALDNEELQIAQNQLVELKRYEPDREKLIYYDKKLEHLKNKLLQRQLIEQDQDRSISTRARAYVGIVLAASCIIMILGREQLDAITGKELSSLRLLIFITCVTIPVLLTMLINRKSLFKNRLGKQASITIILGLIGVLINRIIGYNCDSDPQAIMSLDIFLMGLPLFNAAPALSTGPYLGAATMAVGICALFVPQYTWEITMITGGVLAVLVGAEWLKERKEDKMSKLN